MTLTRVINSDKRLGKFIGGVVFILLILFVIIIKIKLVCIFSASINIPFDKGKLYEGCSDFISFNGNSTIRIDDSGLNISVATLIFNIVFLIGLFEGTVYLIDEKLNI